MNEPRVMDGLELALHGQSGDWRNSKLGPARDDSAATALTLVAHAATLLSLYDTQHRPTSPKHRDWHD